MIISILVALVQTNIAHIDRFLVLMVVLHNLAGLTGGYSLSGLFGWDKGVCHTLAIEVGGAELRL
ncbi:MAG: hypothetical protein JAY90_08000 [Candidatus Thiodiazotropha lotti]|nr:hypothetical protein [Candidatus Thiodiazotropha lotti]